MLAHQSGSNVIDFVRGGGAVRIISGLLSVVFSSFSRCSAVPLDGNFDSCALSFAATTGLCADAVGGAISGERAEISCQKNGSWHRHSHCHWQIGMQQPSPIKERRRMTRNGMESGSTHCWRHQSVSVFVHFARAQSPPTASPTHERELGTRLDSTRLESLAASCAWIRMPRRCARCALASWLRKYRCTSVSPLH